MLLKKYRLSKNKDFQNVFKKGKRFREVFLSLNLVGNKFRFSRFGFIVSNKVSKKSTERHKIKRRLTEIVRFKLPSLKTGFDIVLVANPGIKNKTYQEIERGLNKLLKTSGLNG